MAAATARAVRNVERAMGPSWSGQQDRESHLDSCFDADGLCPALREKSERPGDGLARPLLPTAKDRSLAAGRHGGAVVRDRFVLVACRLLERRERRCLVLVVLAGLAAGEVGLAEAVV